MNTRNGSASPVLEDPTTKATPDQGQPQGGDHQPEQPLKDDETPQPDGDDQASTETPPPKAEKTKPASKSKPADAPAEDPVKAAIEHLRNDGPADKAKTLSKTQPPAKAGDVKPTTGATPEPNDEDDGEDGADSVIDPKDPLNSWTPQERKHTKGAVKTRFRELHTRVAAMEPDADVGKNWSTIVQKERLQPDIDTLDDEQLAWSIRAQGAAIRAVQAVQSGRNPNANDLATLDRLRSGIAEVDKAIGRRETPSNPNAIAEAFTGTIPEDLKEAAELAGLSDKEVRLIAALRTHKAPVNPPPAAPAPAAPPATLRRESEPSQEQNDRVRVSEEFWARKTNKGLTEQMKLKPEQVQSFFDSNITPRLARTLQADFPGMSIADAFKRLGPGERHQMVMDAVAAHRAEQRPTNPPPQSSNRTPLRAGGAPPESPGAGEDPTKVAIARLRSD